MSYPHLELLRIRADASFDVRGRIAGRYGVTIASSTDGQTLWIGAGVPDDAATELAVEFDRAPRPSRPSEPPPALDACERILGRVSGELTRTSGPSYVIPDDIEFGVGTTIARSDGTDTEVLRCANPGNWHPIEWSELLDGKLGPWSMITKGERAISICHTPGRLTERAGECGVWTDPRFRGRGYAAATAAAWIPLVRAGTPPLLQHGRRQSVVAARRSPPEPPRDWLDVEAPSTPRWRSGEAPSALLAAQKHWRDLTARAELRSDLVP